MQTVYIKQDRDVCLSGRDVGAIALADSSLPEDWQQM